LIDRRGADVRAVVLTGLVRVGDDVVAVDYFHDDLRW
jgi:hypothetical protein